MRDSSKQAIVTILKIGAFCIGILLSLGATPRPTTPKKLGNLMRSTCAKMAWVIETAGIKGN